MGSLMIIAGLCLVVVVGSVVYAFKTTKPPPCPKCQSTVTQVRAVGQRTEETLHEVWELRTCQQCGHGWEVVTATFPRSISSESLR